MGFASAESIVLFIVILIVTLVQLRLLRTTWEY
jgi:ABC-type sugar transport system permease subunit